MGRKKLSQLDCATAQAILNHLEIIDIRSPKLAEILQIKKARAAAILKRLGWRREQIKQEARWYKEGMDKLFDTNLRVRVRLKARRLGVILT